MKFSITEFRRLLKALPKEKRTCECGRVFITANFCFISQGTVVCDARYGCGKHHRIRDLLGVNKLSDLRRNKDGEINRGIEGGDRQNVSV